MRSRRPFNRIRIRRPNWGALGFLVALSVSGVAQANPTGPTIVSGSASISGLGSSQVTILQKTPSAIFNWKQFNIAPNEVTRFVQPGASAIALNRIFDANPSQIFGSLQANGSVILLNPNGVLFGPGAQVNVSGLTASSLNLSDADFLKGQYRFAGTGAEGPVKNAGTITTPSGGFVYLLAPNVENSGLIQTPEGQIILAAGSTAYLSQNPDGQGLLVELKAPAGEALNLQSLIADGGTINMFGRVVNQTGLIQANSVQEKEGKIELFASDQLTLASQSVLSAKGSDQGISNGGTVSVISDKGQGTTHFDAGALIDISGGAQGGNGGSAEVSGSQVDLGGSILARARPGYSGGSLLIDPSCAATCTYGPNDFAPLTSGGASSLEFDAVGDLTLRGDGQTSVIDLGQLPTTLQSPGSLTFRSQTGSVTFSGIAIYDAPFGGGYPWNISVTAGKDIILANDGFTTLGTGYGGTMSLTASGNIVAPSTFGGSTFLYTGLRMDSSIPSTLTISAGGNFLGGFLLTAGQASVHAANFGAPDNYANLTLGTGQINITADQSIYLGLVQDKGLSLEETVPSVTADPGNRLSLSALQGDIHLRPIAPPNSGIESWLTIYPASFSASALQGNIFVERNLTFWPSPTGTIDVFAAGAIQGANTTGRGTPVISLVPADPSSLFGLSSVSPTLQNIPALVSSAQVEPVTFKTGSGDISNLTFTLYSPTLRKQVTIDSGGNLSQIDATISVPEGVEATVRAAGNIDMTPVPPTDSGFRFYGTGTAKVYAGGNLNLSTSLGIEQGYDLTPSKEAISEGLLDISVGGNLEMTQSRIITFNGGAIDIHGLQGAGSAVGGSVDVGTNNSASITQQGIYVGIMTLRGGEINIAATGDVNVDASRVATFGGSNIHITSLQGNINAGSGDKSNPIDFVIDESSKDAQGKNVPLFFHAKVPGSGIFTYSPADGTTIPSYPSEQIAIPPPPPFNLPPALAQESLVLKDLGELIEKEVSLGHDASRLEANLNSQAGPFQAQVDQFIAQYEAAYKAEVQNAVQIQNDQFNLVKAGINKRFQLGDIYLNAPSGDVVVPPAGIRGKTISIAAQHLTLQGGDIQGNITLNVDQISGNLNGLVGSVGGKVGGNTVLPPLNVPALPPISLPSGASASAGSSLGGLSGSTGSVSSSSSTTAATTAAAASSVREDAAQQQTAATDQQAAAEDPAQSDGGGPPQEQKSTSHKAKKGNMVRSLHFKKGVTIEVDVSENPS